MPFGGQCRVSASCGGVDKQLEGEPEKKEKKTLERQGGKTHVSPNSAKKNGEVGLLRFSWHSAAATTVAAEKQHRKIRITTRVTPNSHPPPLLSSFLFVRFSHIVQTVHPSSTTTLLILPVSLSSAHLKAHAQTCRAAPPESRTDELRTSMQRPTREESNRVGGLGGLGVDVGEGNIEEDVCVKRQN